MVTKYQFNPRLAFLVICHFHFFSWLPAQTHIPADPFYLLQYERAQFEGLIPMQSNLFRPIFFNSDSTSVSFTLRSEGYFNNSNLFEIKEGDTLGDLIEFSGGTSVETGLKPKFELSTISDDNKRIRKEFGINSPVLLDKIKDGDTLSVLAAYSIKNSVVELRGEFKYTGFYSVSPGER